MLNIYVICGDCQHHYKPKKSDLVIKCPKCHSIVSAIVEIDSDSTPPDWWHGEKDTTHSLVKRFTSFISKLLS